MQTINRNNYEEYFLLYVDNELGAAEKTSVEDFIQQNTDLAIELEMLMRTKFSAEEIEFNDKENLLRTEGNNINETNYEEYFLLYIDDELSAAKREEAERYVLQHPALQDEFITLKQAVLIPEIINYGDKKDLYRKERERTVPLKLWRLAAAAVFIGVCAVGVWLMQKPVKINTPVADNHLKQNQPAQNEPAEKSVDTIHRQILPQQQIVAQQPSGKKENKAAVETTVAKKKKESTNTGKVLNEDTKNDEEQFAVEHRVITHNNIAQQQKEPPVATQDIANIPENLTPHNNDITALQTSPGNTQNQNGYNVYPVAYKEININDEDRSLHVGMLDLNKDKVKTLFKKAGRLFGNKSNDLANEDGKLQIANLEIETKKL